MQRFALSLAAVSLATLAACAVVFASAATAQVISVNPTSIDFGNMGQNESRDTSVTVTNEGAGLLSIREVDADCGCTIPTLAKKELAPGESTVIEINFNSKKFHGNVLKLVHVYSNDPDQPVVDIMLTAKVSAPLLIDPPSQRIGFAQSAVGERVTKQVTFTATELPRLEISTSRSRKGLFEVNCVNNYEGNPRVAVLEVTVPADMIPGRQRDNVRVQTNLEDTPYVDIEISSFVVRKLAISHETVNFRYQNQLSQKIRVTPFIKDLQFKVTGAEIDLPEISVTVDNTIANKEALVRLSGTPISNDDPRAVKANGRIEGTLTIHTDVPDLPTIEIPVSYLVRM